MQRDEIERKILAIIHEQRTMPDDAVLSSTSLAEAGIDSLDALNILFGLEETFGIEIPDTTAKSIRTLSDMTDVVSQILAQKSA